jgi:hypothetical protein
MIPAPLATPVPATPPRNLLWAVDQFHYLGDLGMFEGRRAMLIDGVIVGEGPMNPPHRVALELSGEALRTAFGAGWRVCVQMPLVLGQSTDPEPDVAVVAWTPRGATPPRRRLPWSPTPRSGSTRPSRSPFTPPGWSPTTGCWT